MKLIKVITIGGTEIRDDADSVPVVQLLDVNTTNGLRGYAEVRVDNVNAKYDSLKADATATIALSLSAGETLKTVFVGTVDRVVEGRIKTFFIKGKGASLKEKTIKKSFHKAAAGDVLKAILSKSGLSYKIGTTPSTRFHSYIIPESTLSAAVFVALKTFDLEDFIIVVNDRTGEVTIDKTANLLKETSIEFKQENFRRVESNILDTVLDLEIEVFNKIKISDAVQSVSGHRILIDGRRTRSFITVDPT